MKRFLSTLVLLLFILKAFGQDKSLIEDYEAYADSSLETQFAFVQELLYVAGYVPEKIRVYQTLPNHAHVYRVTLDSVNGGFIFVRWNKDIKEHYVANKMIDPGLYYNLNAAREIMRTQTKKAIFDVEDISLQAEDQFKISGEDIQGLRGEFDKQIQAEKEFQQNIQNKNLEKTKRKSERKKTED